MFNFIKKLFYKSYFYPFFANRIKVSNRINRLKKFADVFAGAPSINRQLYFARKVYELKNQLKSEIVIGHAVQSLFASIPLSKAINAKHIADVIEIPSFKDRAFPTPWHQTTLELTDSAIKQYLRDTNHIFTVSESLKRVLKDINNNVNVFPNYPLEIKFNENNKIRSNCNISDNDILLVSISTITENLEVIINSLKILPENFHLAIVGNIKGPEYKSFINDLIKKLNIEKRVHFFNPVRYDELFSYLSGADIGLIHLNNQIKNHKVSLPNRIFDLMHSNLPIISVDIDDISKIIKDNEIGFVISDKEKKMPEIWAKNIKNLAFYKKEKFKYNLKKINKNFLFDVLSDKFMTTFENCKTVTFVGFTDLAINNRTMRFVKLLNSKNILVNLVFCSSRKKHKDTKLIKYFQIFPI